jgi:hypothetical protein
MFLEAEAFIAVLQLSWLQIYSALYPEQDGILSLTTSVVVIHSYIYMVGVHTISVGEGITTHVIWMLSLHNLPPLRCTQQHNPPHILHLFVLC